MVSSCYQCILGYYNGYVIYKYNTFPGHVVESLEHQNSSLSVDIKTEAVSPSETLDGKMTQWKHLFEVQ